MCTVNRDGKQESYSRRMDRSVSKEERQMQQATRAHMHHTFASQCCKTAQKCHKACKSGMLENMCSFGKHVVTTVKVHGSAEANGLSCSILHIHSVER